MKLKDVFILRRALVSAGVKFPEDATIPLPAEGFDELIEEMVTLSRTPETSSGVTEALVYGIRFVRAEP